MRIDTLSMPCTVGRTIPTSLPVVRPLRRTVLSDWSAAPACKPYRGRPGIDWITGLVLYFTVDASVSRTRRPA